MKELFKNTLVVLAAASVFGGSGYLGVSLVNSYVDSRIEASSSTADSTVAPGDVNAIAGKLINKLLK